MLEESVVYQDILQKGVQKGMQKGMQKGLQEGLQKGRQEGKRQLLSRQLERLIGKLSIESRKKIEELNSDQLEELGVAMLDFQSEKDLSLWIERQTAAN